VIKFVLILGMLVLGTRLAVALPFPSVTVWLDENGHEVVVAFGVTRATNMPEVDRDKATFIARVNMASYLRRNVLAGSSIVGEWRHAGSNESGGLEIVAVEWSAARARFAAPRPDW
jgi:hypothetical protein